MIDGDGMAIEKYLKPSDVFDPIPTYDGQWVFSLDENFSRNAIVDGDINLFIKFMEENYCKPLYEIFKTKRILDLPVKMISTPNENKQGRCLRFSKVDFFIELTAFLNQNIDRYGKDKDVHYEDIMNLANKIPEEHEITNLAFSEALKTKAEKLKDVMNNEINSKYFEAAMKDYAPYKGRLDFSTYIRNNYNLTIDFQNGLLQLGNFFDKKIDFEKFVACFDYDKFYLLMTKIVLEVCYEREKGTGYIDNCYPYLYRYKRAMDKVVEENKKYDPRIFYKTSKGQKNPRYSRWQFMEEFKILMERHPEAKVIVLPELAEGEIDKYKDINLIKKIVAIYGEETSVNWKFLPQGETIKKSEFTRRKEPGSSKVDKDKLIDEVNMRIDIMEKSGYLGRPIKGLDTFSGYYAFVYSNGKVILEKFWENEETLNPAVGCATYVMTIDNFIEMSKISKLNLIEYMKTLPESGIKRIFHTSVNNWQRCLNDEINGTYRLEDAIAFIESLKSGALNNE